MRVFVTGATGYIGSAVVDALLANGDQVIGLARSDEAAQSLAGKGVDPLRGDMGDHASLKRGAAGADGVIHTATTNNGDADRAAVEAMLEALGSSNKPFVFTSGVWVLGDTDGKVANEDSPVNPAAVVAWRPGLEDTVLVAANDGVRSLVIRPAIVYGRGGGLVTGFIETAKADGARYIGDGENRWTGVHVDDLADLYVAAVHNGPAGSVLHGASGDAVRVRHIADAANRAVGAGPCLTPWPLEEARQTLGPLADALVMDQQISGMRARRVLGWSPHRPALLEEIEHGSYRPSSK